VIKDAEGNITELICTYDPDSRGGWTKDERKVKGTLHWVSAKHNTPVEVRLYDQLFTVPNPMDPEEGKTWLDYLNPDSLVTMQCYGEPCLKDSKPGERFQFLRMGYFVADYDSTPAKPVFNRIVTLKDTWAKMEKKL
jgi:glutaminyl-tRNA synthetase